MVSAIRLTSLQYTTMTIPPSLSSLSSLLTTAISSSNLRIPRFDFTQKEPPRKISSGVFLSPHPPAVCRHSAPCRRPPLFPIAPQPQAAVRRSDVLVPYPPSACKSAQKSRPENRAACIFEKLLELYALTNRIGYGKLYALCGVAGQFGYIRGSQKIVIVGGKPFPLFVQPGLFRLCKMEPDNFGG